MSLDEINMGDIGDGRNATKKTYVESHKEVRELNFFNKLGSWKEVSKRDMSKIMDYHSSKIEKAFRELFKEVWDLKDELSVTKKEREEEISKFIGLRNHLVETVDNLRRENRQ